MAQYRLQLIAALVTPIGSLSVSGFMTLNPEPKESNRNFRFHCNDVKHPKQRYNLMDKDSDRDRNSA